VGSEPTGVVDLATGYDETHGRQSTRCTSA
jgi:hypothetical protein